MSFGCACEIGSERACMLESLRCCFSDCTEVRYLSFVRYYDPAGVISLKNTFLLLKFLVWTCASLTKDDILLFQRYLRCKIISFNNNPAFIN